MINYEEKTRHPVRCGNSLVWRSRSEHEGGYEHGFRGRHFVVIGTSLLVSPANTLTACSGASHNIVIDPGEVEIPEGFLHIKETATVGMEMLYQSLVKLTANTK